MYLLLNLCRRPERFESTSTSSESDDDTVVKIKKPKQKRAPAVPTVYPSEGTEGRSLSRAARSSEVTEGHGLSQAARSSEDTEGRSLSQAARSSEGTEGHGLSHVTTPITGRGAGGSCRSLPPSASARPVSTSAAEDRNNTSKSK